MIETVRGDPIVAEAETARPACPIVAALRDCDSRIDLLRDAAWIEQALWERICSSGAKALSLDVFDTLLLRDNSSEERRHYNAAERFRENDPALHCVSAADVYLARLFATRASYRLRPVVHGCREGHISEIVRGMRRQLGLSSASEPAALAAELAEERTRLTINPVMTRLVQRAVGNAMPVVLLSDTYLGASQIRDLIEFAEPGLTEKFVGIVSSADAQRF